ncbi:50S ribosomal protein L25/general stress protein Ctc [Humibacter sp.]|jgi:large subunit ribosomal protein L25|uniref:50S ribosomal protein L25/general stress protein Ctc n=1 Tax=Humibacter sp. TaxID=1940291 RepID=UPI002C2B203F|nr:50S ribosomal protein L25/general stress protein Ctc [Humibacter sp.]HVX07500.1 50S ribosomal protein L25/general stress protein Ctc [Humibacter sp.]
MADDSNKVVAENRDQFGKGAARKIRAAGKIPAVLYGHGTDPQHLTLPAHQLGLILRKANAVLDLDIAGTSQLALVKDVQKDPVHQIIEHIDLIIVRRGEKVQIDIPVHVEGEPFSGTIVVQDLSTVSVEAEATHIPEHIVVDVEGLEDGTHITAADLELPAGSTLLSDPEALVVAITLPSAPAAEATEEAEEAAQAEAAETGSAE